MVLMTDYKQDQVNRMKDHQEERVMLVQEQARQEQLQAQQHYQKEFHM
jgi:hypothetical protein